MNKQKILDYYMNLKYSIEITPIPEKDGGGYEASIPQLGKYAFCGSGDTIEESLKSLEEVKKSIFSDYIKRGISIPEPKSENEFSGKFLLRIPARLHMELTKLARKDKVSLNQYICILLEKQIEINEFLEKINEFYEQMQESFYESIKKKIFEWRISAEDLMEQIPQQIDPGSTASASVVKARTQTINKDLEVA